MNFAGSHLLLRYALVCVLMMCVFIPAGSAQVYICDQQFFGAPAMPSGFSSTGTAITGSSSGTGNFGRNAPSLRFDQTGQVLRFGPWSQDADHVSFFYKCASSAASTIVVEESVDGTNWTAVGTVTAMSTSATYDADLLPTSRYLRFVFTLAATGGFVYFDDLRIRALTSACSDPLEILEVLIDGGCTSSSCEDGNEFVYFDTGSQPLDTRYFELVNPSVISGGAAYGGNGSGDNANTSWTLASAYTATQNIYIQDLNAIAGCGNVFVPVPADNIVPANSRVLAITGSAPDALYNLSAYCANAPVYVLFSTRNNCPTTSGKYSNSACSANCTRYITIFNHQYGCLDNEQYSQNTSATPNGQAFVFSGGTYGYSTVYSCLLMMLPLEIESISGISLENGVELNWKIGATEGLSAFVVERSRDGHEFTELSSVEVISEDARTYQYLDTEALNGLNYYRLRLQDKDGIETVSSLIVPVMVRGQNEWSLVVKGDWMIVSSASEHPNASLSWIGADGRTYGSEMLKMTAGSSLELQIPDLARGIFLVQIQDGESRFSRRFVRVN